MSEELFAELDEDLQERVKIQIAQDAGIVVKQGERLIALLAPLHAEGAKEKGPKFNFHADAVGGEIYLFLIAASQFCKRFEDYSSPDCLTLNTQDLIDIRNVRNIWEHRADYLLSGEDSYSRLRPASKQWLTDRLPDNRAEVFQASAAPGFYRIAKHINILKIVREAREWWDLVL